MKPPSKWKNRTICIDCDGVLVNGTTINQAVVDRAKELHDAGWEIVIWSARGRGYAFAIACAAGLTGVGYQAIGKPILMVDDRPQDFFRYCKVARNLYAITTQDNETTRDQGEAMP